jgi:hypothetical protein
VLHESFYPQAHNGFPAGIISASAIGLLCAGTMWTRDAGTLLRELVVRGYYSTLHCLARQSMLFT